MVTPWVYDGDLTAAHALGVGQLTIKKFKSPPLPHVVPGGGVGVHIDKCIIRAENARFYLSNSQQSGKYGAKLLKFCSILLAHCVYVQLHYGSKQYSIAALIEQSNR